MKILRTIGILAIVAALFIGGTGSAFAKGPPDEPPGGGQHSKGKLGLFGTVSSVITDVPNVQYTITLEAKQGTVDVTINGDNGDTKYKVPRETRGAKADLDTFIGLVDKNEDGNLEELEGRRLAILATNLVEVDTEEFTADALRLMLIPTAPPQHAHRVGIVQEGFTPGEGGSITIIDNHGVSHTFDVTVDTVYRPAAISELEEAELIEEMTGHCVTVVTKGDPKLGPPAKAIVLHEELPDWAGGKIIIRKITDPSGNTEIFEFTAEYYPSSFSLSDGDHDNSGWLEPDTYDVTEALPEGWENPVIEIETEDTDDTSTSLGSTATIDLDRGETITVTFTNTFILTQP